ncbi:hypothetical protein ACT7DB_00525 [Bacillus cereus]
MLFWLINTSALFSVVDTFGNEKLSFTDVPQGANATLLGCPVYLVNGLVDKDSKNIAFGLVHPDAYGITISDVKVIQPKLDTPQVQFACRYYGVEVWIDGRVLDDYSKRARYFAPDVQQASVTEQSVKRKATKIEKRVTIMGVPFGTSLFFSNKIRVLSRRKSYGSKSNRYKIYRY